MTDAERLAVVQKNWKPLMDELFSELGNKRAGNWGIINDSMIAIEKVLRELENSDAN